MRYSILYPNAKEPEYKMLSEVAFHDLGMDTITKNVGRNSAEQEMIRRTMCAMTADPAVTTYRCEVFDDIFKNPGLREQILKLLDKVNFIRDYGIRRDLDEKSGIWDLMHRLDEVNDYIHCVEDIFECLSEYDLKSEGLVNLRKYVDVIYHEEGFAALKEDIAKLNATTSTIRSVTLGVNLNGRFEAESIGLVSVNDKQFTRSNIISNFSDKILNSEGIHKGNDWDGSYKYHVMNAKEGPDSMTLEELAAAKIAIMNPLLAVGMSYVGQGDIAADITRYMDKIVNHLLHGIVSKLRNVLGNHVTISIRDITELIPEFTYYVRWAEYIEKARKKGMRFNRAYAMEAPERGRTMIASEIYNLKLADSCDSFSGIVSNTILFDEDNSVYILTGANRGGKTTITQATGQMFLMAQGGIYAPCASFRFLPADCIYTHFPADEDKTMDLGRLGEECRRFKELYGKCTEQSLLLLNETFSTTSFEEGYYIACDAVKAMLTKGLRCIYNTHMHKLAYSLEDFEKYGRGAASLVVESKDGVCTYRVKAAPPEGLSYARAIAEKYGVTYEELCANADAEETSENVPEDSNNKFI